MGERTQLSSDHLIVLIGEPGGRDPHFPGERRFGRPESPLSNVRHQDFCVAASVGVGGCGPHSWLPDYSQWQGSPQWAFQQNARTELLSPPPPLHCPGLGLSCKIRIFFSPCRGEICGLVFTPVERNRNSGRQGGPTCPLVGSEHTMTPWRGHVQQVYGLVRGFCGFLGTHYLLPAHSVSPLSTL